MSYYRRKSRYNPAQHARTVFVRAPEGTYIVGYTRFALDVLWASKVTADSVRRWSFRFDEHPQLEAIYNAFGWDLVLLVELLQELN